MIQITRVPLTRIARNDARHGSPYPYPYDRTDNVRLYQLARDETLYAFMGRASHGRVWSAPMFTEWRQA